MLCRVNDIIVSVNGISTVNVTHGQAVDALKRAGNVVSLVCVSLQHFIIVVTDAAAADNDDDTCTLLNSSNKRA